MLVRPGPSVLFTASVAILLLSGCDWMHKKDPAPPRPKLAPRIHLAAVDQRACGSQGTYEQLKNLVFDTAVRVREGHRGSLDQLATYSAVRMEDPLLKRRDDDLNVTVCTGRFILDLPPGAEKGFAGERQLVADVEYAAQTAADGSGPVYRMQGAEPLVYKLAIFDLQAQVRQAAGGPVVTFAAAQPLPDLKEVPIPPPHNTVLLSPAERADAARKSASVPLGIAEQAAIAPSVKPKQALSAIAPKPQPTRLADRTALARAKAPAAKPKAAPTRLAAVAAAPQHGKPKALPTAGLKPKPVRLADRSEAGKTKGKPSPTAAKPAARTQLAKASGPASKGKPKIAPSAAPPVRTATVKPHPSPAKPAIKLASAREAPARPAAKLTPAPTRAKAAKPEVKLASASPRPIPAKPAAKPVSPPQETAKPAVKLASAPQRPVEVQPQPKPIQKAAANPSFDCRGAQTTGERLVCANNRLASLDRAMFSLYRAAFGDGNNSTRDRLRRTRERFVAWRDRCANENCLASAYQGRMDEIRDIMSNR